MSWHERLSDFCGYDDKASPGGLRTMWIKKWGKITNNKSFQADVF